MKKLSLAVMTCLTAVFLVACGQETPKPMEATESTETAAPATQPATEEAAPAPAAAPAEEAPAPAQ